MEQNAMTTNETQTISIFGTRPQNAIYLPPIPYAVRLNCKDGGLFVGGKDPKHRKTNPDDKIEISILKATEYYGDLGKTEGVRWTQLFFVPAPSVAPEILPPNTVCVTYIKKQSVAHLYHTVQSAMNNGDPGFGIFTVSFNKENGVDGPYYTVDFEWRERNNEAENQQLDSIKAFLGSFANQLIELEGTRDMTCIQGMTAQQIAEIMMEAELEEEVITLPTSKKQRRLQAAS
jgi:hypothetical protein